MIYTFDHEPAHVHITGADQAKINLLGRDGKPELVSTIGIKHADLRRLFEEVAELQNQFLQAWERIHGRSD